MKEQSVPMQVRRVDLVCECGGSCHPTGDVYSNGIEYICPACKFQQIIPRSYPRLEFMDHTSGEWRLLKIV